MVDMNARPLPEELSLSTSSPSSSTSIGPSLDEHPQAANRHSQADFIVDLQKELLLRLSWPGQPPLAQDVKEIDVEKGGADTASDDELFDLESYLRGGLAAKQAAGIRPKHIGVYWDGLTVKGRGGVTNYVKTIPDAAINFFDYVTPALRMLGLLKTPEVTLLDNFRGVCKPGEMVLVLGKLGKQLLDLGCQSGRH